MAGYTVYTPQIEEWAVIMTAINFSGLFLDNFYHFNNYQELQAQSAESHIISLNNDA